MNLPGARAFQVRMEPRDPELRNTDPTGEGDASPALLQALRALGAADPASQAPGSDAFLADVQSRFAPLARRRRTRVFATWSSAAAALLLVWAGWRWMVPPPSGARPGADPHPDATVEVGDLDRDGRTDILDALALARALDRGEAAAYDVASADLSGDRRVDRADVEAIARRAVSLDQRGGR